MEEDSIGASATKTTYFLFIGKFVGIVITALTFIVVARLLGPSSYGIYTLALGFSLLVDAVGHFGIGTYLNVHLASFRYKKDVEGISKSITSGFVALIPIALLISGIGVGISGYAAKNIFVSSNVEGFTLALASLSIFFSMIYGTLYPALIGLGKGKQAASINVINYSVQFTLSVSLVILGFGVNGAIAGVVAGYFIGMLAGIYFLFSSAHQYGAKLRHSFDRAKVRDIISFSIPMAANNFLNNSISNFAILMLGIFATPYLLGNYGAATKGLAVLLAVYGTIGTVLIPTFSASLTKNNKTEYIEGVLNKVLLYALIVTLPVVVYFAVFSKSLIYLLISKSYGTAPYFLTLISIGVFIGVIGSYLNSIFIAARRVSKALKYNAISITVQFVLLVLLIPLLKVIGAIISMFYVGAFISSTIFAYEIYKNFKVKISFNTISRIFFGNFILGLCILPLIMLHSSILQLVSGILAIVLIYPAILFATGVITAHVVEDMNRLSRGLPVISIAINYISKYIEALSKIFKVKVQ